MKKTYIFLLLVVAIIVIGVGSFYYSRPEEKSIKISSNPWVGFTPFIYAQEKGWLDKTPFQFLWQVDLSDNSRLYERGFTQGFTATQYELLHFKNYTHIKPVFLIDRSYGADVILSNRSLDDLKKSDENVTVYLELGSLNEDFFDAFIQENKLKRLKFTFVNSSQKRMLTLSTSENPMILISYDPYVSEFLKKGYLQVASTRTIKSFFAIDALFVDEEVVNGREKAYGELLSIFNRALKALKENPQEYYNTIKGYLEGQSYEDFMLSTTQIQWLNSGTHKDIQMQLQTQHISTQKLIK
jgi:NitT/TauT family transport system substrate-binding protein